MLYPAHVHHLSAAIPVSVFKPHIPGQEPGFPALPQAPLFSFQFFRQKFSDVLRCGESIVLCAPPPSWALDQVQVTNICPTNSGPSHVLCSTAAGSLKPIVTTHSRCLQSIPVPELLHIKATPMPPAVWKTCFYYPDCCLTLVSVV